MPIESHSVAEPQPRALSFPICQREDGSRLPRLGAAWGQRWEEEEVLGAQRLPCHPALRPSIAGPAIPPSVCPRVGLSLALCCLLLTLCCRENPRLSTSSQTPLQGGELRGALVPDRKRMLPALPSQTNWDVTHKESDSAADQGQTLLLLRC